MRTVAAGEQVLPVLRPGPTQEITGGGELVRFLAAFAALSAGLTFFALAADNLLAAKGPAAIALGALTGLWAVVHTLWGILALRNGPAGSLPEAWLVRFVPTALPAVGAVVLVFLAWGALLAPAGSRTFNLTLASALALVLLQLGASAAQRRQASAPRFGSQPAPGRLLVGLFFSAVLVAGIATPGLAASTAGDNAVPHGTHGTAPAPSDHAGH